MKIYSDIKIFLFHNKETWLGFSPLCVQSADQQLLMICIGLDKYHVLKMLMLN